MLISKKFFPALIGAYQDRLICRQWSCLTIPLSALHQQLFLQGFFFPHALGAETHPSVLWLVVLTQC